MLQAVNTALPAQPAANNIDGAYSRIDDNFRRLQTVLDAISWIAGEELQQSAAAETARNAITVIFGLADLANHMMENEAFDSVADLHNVALESLCNAEGE